MRHRSIVLLITIVAIGALAFGAIYLHYGSIRPPYGKGTRAHMWSIALAVDLYRDEYGELPPSDSRRLFSALTGTNPKGIRFLSHDESDRNFSAHSDRWGTPIRILMSSHAVGIWSAGVDLEFEDVPGEGDDLFL